jgi:hypothetical protein
VSPERLVASRPPELPQIFRDMLFVVTGYLSENGDPMESSRDWRRSGTCRCAQQISNNYLTCSSQFLRATVCGAFVTSSR